MLVLVSVSSNSRHEHLEHGTERLSRLKRSGDHVILGGDANSHLGPDERLKGFVGRFGSTRRLRHQGSVGSLWKCKKVCSMWILTCHVKGDARGTTTLWESGTSKMSLYLPLDFMAIDGDGARTRLLELITEGNMYPFLPLGRRKHPKYSDEASEKPKHPLRWDLTRGRGDEAQRLTCSWQKSLETQVEAGELKKETIWENIAEVMRGVAERNDMPCLRACRKEVLHSKKRVAESYTRLQNA